MVTYRENTGRSAAWLLALIFNGLLFLLPVIAARVVVIAFAGAGIGQAPTPEALNETRRNIEAAFEKIAPSSSERRVYWGKLVDRELRSGDLSAARGFLLAAPQMLNRDDMNTVRAAAASEITGTEDERLAKAAVRFLPDPVSAKYKAALRPPTMPVPEREETPEDPSVTDLGDDGMQPAPTPARALSAVPTASFSVLGDLEDLAANSRRWMNGDEADSFVLRLTGLATIEPDMPATVDLIEAASILKGAHRAGRITPAYLSLLESRLSDVMDERDLRPELENAFSQIAPMSVLGARVKEAYANAYDGSRLGRLTIEIELINRIADATSPSGAITLLEHVEGAEDMRRARLIAEAGGDRAAALVKQNGAKALELARSGIQFTTPLILQIMMLVAISIALTLAFLAILQRTFSGRRRKAAIY